MVLNQVIVIEAYHQEDATEVLILYEFVPVVFLAQNGLFRVGDTFVNKILIDPDQIDLEQFNWHHYAHLAQGPFVGKCALQ
jgi:hypothetical protein